MQIGGLALWVRAGSSWAFCLCSFHYPHSMNRGLLAGLPRQKLCVLFERQSMAGGLGQQWSLRKLDQGLGRVCVWCVCVQIFIG